MEIRSFTTHAYTCIAEHLGMHSEENVESSIHLPRAMGNG